MDIQACREHNASRHTLNPVFYLENDGSLLIMNLYFACPSDVGHFQTALNTQYLDDIKQLQMFERPPMNAETGTYKCHIACKKLYKNYVRDVNNIVNGELVVPSIL
jgi:hypothetical protein